MPSWIAINLSDFHDPTKKWQRGEDNRVEATVIRAKTLERAKETAQCGNNDPWMVFNISRTENIIYAKPDAAKIESDLREMWSKRGIPKERQDELLKDVEEKAKPGAWIGPFQIPE